MAQKAVKTLKSVVNQYRNNQKNVLEEQKYDPKEQSEGIKKRLDASGIDVEKATDERSFLEKAFNLPNDQNVIFDIFEVLNRPQQALFGGIHSAVEGDDFFKGAADGLTGRKDTQFKDILNTADITEETDGTLGLDDVLGFAGDVFLDPVDWAFLPAKGIKAGAKAVDVAKDAVRTAALGVDAANDLVKARTAVEAISNVSNLSKAEEIANLTAYLSQKKQILQGAEDALFVAEETYKKLPKARRTFAQLAMSGLGSGFKGMFTLADSGITKTLKYMDDSYLAKAAILGQDTKGFKPALETFDSLKAGFNRAFNAVKTMPEGLINRIRNINGKRLLSKKEMLEKLNHFNATLGKMEPELAAKFNMSVDEFSEAILALVERGDSLFDNSGKLTIKGMSRKTSFDAIINSDVILTNQSIPEQTAIQLEQFIKTEMPEWYNSVIGEGGDLFHVTEVGNKTGKQYRIKNRAILEDLKKYYGGISDEKILRGQQKGGEFTQELSDQILELDAQIKGLEKARGKKTLRKGSSAAEEVDRLGSRIDYLTENKAAWMRVIDKNREMGASQSDIDKLIKIVREADLEVDKHYARISELIDSEGILADDLIGELTGTKNKLIDDFDKQGVYTGSMLKEKARLEFDMPIHYNERYKAILEKMADDDGVREFAAGLHAMYSESADIVSQVMKSGFKYTDGYAPHTLTKEWQDLKINTYDLTTKTYKDVFDFKGNSSSFTARRYRGSVGEVNDLAKGYVNWLIDNKVISKAEDIDRIKAVQDLKIFETDLNTSMVDFINKSTRTTADAQIYSYVVENTFLNTKDTNKYRNVIMNDPKVNPDFKAPSGFVKVGNRAIAEKFESLKGYISEEDVERLSEGMKSWLSANASKEVYLDKNIDVLIGRLSDRKEKAGLIVLLDKLNTMFKSNKLLSPGFQLRNWAGNISNMWLSGMSLPEIIGGYRGANRVLKKGEKLMSRVAAGEVLSAADKLLYDEFIEFAGHGFYEYGNALHDIPEKYLNVNNIPSTNKVYNKLKEDNPNLKRGLKEYAAMPKELYNKTVSYNMRKNQEQDILSRFVLWKHGKKNPKWLSDQGYMSPDSAVRTILFDYEDLSAFEKEYMKKIVPFYTFTKKNIGFQMANMMKNTTKYNQLIKGFNSLWGTLDLSEEELDRYKMENFWIPIPVKKEDGTYYTIKSSLPFGDLGEFLDNPLQRSLASAAPVVRAPFEVATNKQIFSGMPISNFKGEKGYYLPELSKHAEYGLSQFGLDVPAMAVSDVLRTAKGVATGDITNPSDAFVKGLGRSLVSEGNAKKTAERAAYNELDNLQNLLRYYKQEDIDIMKLSEINNRQKNNNANALIQRIRSLRQ